MQEQYEKFMSDRKKQKQQDKQQQQSAKNNNQQQQQQQAQAPPPPPKGRHDHSNMICILTWDAPHRTQPSETRTRPSK
jgi:hypothetical protein